MIIYGNVAGKEHPCPTAGRPVLTRCSECGRPSGSLEDGRCQDCLKFEKAHRELRTWRKRDAWRRKHG